MASHLKDIINTVLGANTSWQLKLLSQWNTIVGTMQTNVQLLRIQEDTLVLGVPDACWMQELYLLSPLLIKTINSHLDQPRIKQIRFKAVGITKPKKEIVYEKQQEVPKNIPLVLNQREKEVLAAIGDQELRNSLQRLLQRCKIYPS